MLNEPRYCEQHVLQALVLQVHGFDAAGPNEQNAIGQPSDDVLRQFLARQQFLGQHGIFGLH